MTEQKRRETLEESLKALPIVEYQWMDAEELEFSQKVRYICRTECPRYGKSWSCPPAVGSVEECRKRCLEFQELFVFSTVAEVMDLENMEEVLKSKTGHERIIRKIRDIFRPYFGEILALSGGGERFLLYLRGLYLSGRSMPPSGGNASLYRRLRNCGSRPCGKGRDHVYE